MLHQCERRSTLIQYTGIVDQKSYKIIRFVDLKFRCHVGSLLQLYVLRSRYFLQVTRMLQPFQCRKTLAKKVLLFGTISKRSGLHLRSFGQHYIYVIETLPMS